MLTQYVDRTDMSIVVKIEKEVGWLRLWDLAMDNGVRCTDGLKNFVRVFTFPPHATPSCPLCEKKDIQRGFLLYSHVLDNGNISGDQLLRELVLVTDSDSILFDHLLVFVFHWLSRFHFVLVACVLFFFFFLLIFFVSLLCSVYCINPLGLNTTFGFLDFWKRSNVDIIIYRLPRARIIIIIILLLQFSFPFERMG